jgi:hypothetical protein
MLPEACAGQVQDDLKENAIWVEDGGDGVFSGSDYFLFFAQGPHQWKKDSLNKRFAHEKNLFYGKGILFSYHLGLRQKNRASKSNCEFQHHDHII